jgi:hypothetical protein
MSDPEYLDHLGDLATLKNFIKGSYYQSVWDDYDDDIEIWNDYSDNVSKEGLIILKQQIDFVLDWSPQKIFDFVEEIGSFGGLVFDDPGEVVEWFTNLSNFLNDAIKSK